MIVSYLEPPGGAPGELHAQRDNEVLIEIVAPEWARAPYNPDSCTYLFRSGGTIRTHYEGNQGLLAGLYLRPEPFVLK